MSNGDGYCNDCRCYHAPNEHDKKFEGYKTIAEKSGMLDDIGTESTCGFFPEPLVPRDKTSTLELTGDADIDGALRSCLDIMRVKGADYTMGSKDRLHNFRTVGEFCGMTMEQTFSVYFYKHVSALFNYIKTGGQSESEPIEGRVKDCIVYLLLFSKMLAERKRESAPKMSSEDVERMRAEKNAEYINPRARNKK